MIRTMCISEAKKNPANRLYQWAGIFAFLSIFLIPYPFHIFPNPEATTGLFLIPALQFVAESIFGITIENPGITSDSTYLYLLLLCILIFSVLLSCIPARRDKKKSYNILFFAIVEKMIVCYLAIQLFKYGFDKIFKYQFNLPEPNILYMPLGKLDKDILFWSTMGSSYSYNVFMGLMEVIPAILILFKKTRIIGLIIATGVLTHVVAINFCFDISVKVYSLFLLFLSLYLLLPSIQLFYTHLMKEESDKVQTSPVLFTNGRLNRLFKSLTIVFILTESLLPYFRENQFNDDKVARPYLHGAYEVSEKTMHSSNIRRLFIHRRGYMVIQSDEDDMIDYKLTIDQERKVFVLTDYELLKTTYPYEYDEKTGVLQLWSDDGNLFLKACTIDWKNLPLLAETFHWTVDGND